MPASIAPRGSTSGKRPSIMLGAKGKQYVPQSILGRGSFGVAFLATRADNPSVCLVMKRIELGHMDKKAREAAQNECKILTQLLECPFVVHVVEHFVEMERLWIISEQPFM